MLFDKKGIYGFGTVITTIIIIIYTSVESTSTWFHTESPLVFWGVLLQIIGVTVGGYTFRKIFTGGFDPKIFDDKIFQTAKKTFEYRPIVGGISILLIIFGLWLQLIDSIFN